MIADFFGPFHDFRNVDRTSETSFRTDPNIGYSVGQALARHLREDLRSNALPQAKAMLGDKGYDADRFRAALIERGIVPCIPSKANRKVQIDHDRTLYRQRHKIENMFGRLKDWRRIHTRYARSAFDGAAPEGIRNFLVRTMRGGT